MGVNDFYAAVTPGTKPTDYSGEGNFKVLHDGDERSDEVFVAQRLAISPLGGVLNQVCIVGSGNWKNHRKIL